LPDAQFVYPCHQRAGIIGAAFNQRPGDLFFVPGTEWFEDDAHAQGRRDLGERAKSRINVAG
jgi:hypothetical protein